MSVDYLALLLVNMAAGLATLAWLVLRGLERADARSFAAPFAAVGAVAFLLGLHTVTVWPLPSMYNNIHGQTTVLLACCS